MSSTETTESTNGGEHAPDEKKLDALKDQARKLARQLAGGLLKIEDVALALALVVIDARSACYAPAIKGKDSGKKRPGYLPKGSQVTLPDWGGASAAFKSWYSINVDVMMADAIDKHVATLFVNAEGMTEQEITDERAIEKNSLMQTLRNRLRYRVQTQLRSIAPAGDLEALNLSTATQSARQSDRQSDQAPQFDGLVSDEKLKDTENPFDLDAGMSAAVAILLQVSERIKTDGLTPAESEKLVKHAERIASLATRISEAIAEHDAQVEAGVAA